MRAILRALLGAWRALLGLSRLLATSVAQFAGLSGFLVWSMRWRVRAYPVSFVAS